MNTPISPRTRRALIEAVEAVDLVQLTEAAATVDYRQDGFVLTYQPVVMHFLDVATMMTYETFAAAAVMVFGLLEERVALVPLDEGRNEDVAEIANAAATRWDIDISEVALVAEAFGGRLEPTSLLLHFCNTDRYAMWTPAIFAFVLGREPYEGELDDLDVYEAYQERMRSLSTSIQAQQIAKLVRVVSPEMSRLGAIQTVMQAVGQRMLVA